MADKNQLSQPCLLFFLISSFQPFCLLSTPGALCSQIWIRSTINFFQRRSLRVYQERAYQLLRAKILKSWIQKNIFIMTVLIYVYSFYAYKFAVRNWTFLKHLIRQNWRIRSTSRWLFTWRKVKVVFNWFQFLCFCNLAYQ